MRRTAVIGGAAAVTTVGAFAVELGRVWRRGSAPLPADAENVVGAAVEAGVETTAVAVAGYQAAPTQENALFNLFASFVVSLLAARGIAFVLRKRPQFGPFRNLRVGRRHIHHFVPGILIAFASGTTALLTDDEALEERLAATTGIGMGLTFDEAALLLDLRDVYWTREGLLSVQLSLGATAILSIAILTQRMLRRGERREEEAGRIAPAYALGGGL
jgi:hypothetical protein